MRTTAYTLDQIRNEKKNKITHTFKQQKMKRKISKNLLKRRTNADSKQKLNVHYEKPKKLKHTMNTSKQAQQHDCNSSEKKNNYKLA